MFSQRPFEQGDAHSSNYPWKASGAEAFYKGAHKPWRQNGLREWESFENQLLDWSMWICVYFSKLIKPKVPRHNRRNRSSWLWHLGNQSQAASWRLINQHFLLAMEKMKARQSDSNMLHYLKLIVKAVVFDLTKKSASQKVRIVGILRSINETAMLLQHACSLSWNIPRPGTEIPLHVSFTWILVWLNLLNLAKRKNSIYRCIQWLWTFEIRLSRFSKHSMGNARVISSLSRRVCRKVFWQHCHMWF